MRELIDIILRLRKEGSGIRETKTELDGLEKSAGKAESGLSGIGDTMGKLAAVAGGVTAAFVTLKKGYDFAKEGAAIGQTRESFDRLMDSMGVAPGILQRLSGASRGTVDDMTIMSSTLTLLAGTSKDLGKAMVDAAPDLMEIAKAAHKLNPAAGDVEYFYQSIATGIKRSSPLILDNLGLVVKVGDANEAMAKKLGKSVDALSAEEKQMALLTAVLEGGDRMIEQVGGSTEEMGDSFARLETIVKNTGDALKEGFADIVVGIIDATTNLTKYEEVMESNQDVAMRGADSWKEYALALVDVSLASGKLKDFEAESLKEIIEGTKEAGWGTQQLATHIGLLTEEEYGLAKETERVSEKWQAYADALHDVLSPQALLNAAIEKSSQDTADLAGNVQLVADMMEARAAKAADDFRGSLDLLHAAISGEVGEAFEEYNVTIEGLTSKLEELRAKEAELSTQPLVTQSQRDKLTDLRGDIAETTGKLGEAQAAYAEMMAEGASAEDLEKAQANIDKWQGKLDELNTTVGRTWRDIDQATKGELADVREGIEETTAAIEAESEAFARNTRELAFNIAEKQILDALEKGLIEDVNRSGTAFDEANTILWTAAERLGLVDEATVQFMEGIQGATEAVIAGEISIGYYSDSLDYMSGRAGTVRGSLEEMANEIRNLPEFKKFVLEYETKYTATGAPPPVELPEGTPEFQGQGYAYQHGGQFVVRGPAGPDRVPVMFRATAGEVVTVTPAGAAPPPNPAVTNNYNLTLNTMAHSQGIIRDFGIMQAMIG